MTLAELQSKLAASGVSVGIRTQWRFFAQHGVTCKKKTGHTVEQGRPDVQRQRQRWFDGQFDLDPERFVFIDETWIATNMTRSLRDERLRMGFPHGLAKRQR